MKNHEENKNDLNLLEGTNPEIQKFFTQYGHEALEAYASTRLFHATHSTNLDTIASEGLHASSELIEEPDVAFLADAFERSGGAKDLGQKERFDHYIIGRGYDEEAQSPRGVYLSSVVESANETPDSLLEARSYGIPERLTFFIQNLNQLATGEVLDDQTRQQAAIMRDKYIEKLLKTDAAIVLLEVDPLAPEVINERLATVHLQDLSDPDWRRDTLRYANSGDVQLPGPISPEYLAIADAKRIERDEVRRRLLASPEMTFFH
ncbi:MAG: hypothetical protein U0524_03625 [Candidatus Saccharimonadales bacterium]